MIPVRVSANGLDYLLKNNITLKELIQMKEICKNLPSDHYMLTPGIIEKLGTNINGSTIEAYTQAYHKKYIHLSDVCYHNFVNIKHQSSRIGSFKRGYITERVNIS